MDHLSGLSDNEGSAVGSHVPNSEIKVEFVDDGEDSIFAEKPRKGKERPRRVHQKKVCTNAYVQPNSTSLQKTARWGRANPEVSNQTVLKKLDEPRKVKPTLARQWGEILALEKQVKCPIPGCSKVYGSVTGLKNHYKWCDAEQSEMGNGCYPCPVCGSELASMVALQNHLWLMHCPPPVVHLNQSSLPDSDLELSILSTTEEPIANMRPQRNIRPPDRLIDGTHFFASPSTVATPGGNEKRAYLQMHSKRKRLEPIAYGAQPSDGPINYAEIDEEEQEDEELEDSLWVAPPPPVKDKAEEPEPKRRGRKPGRPRKVTRETVVLQEDEQPFGAPDKSNGVVVVSPQLEPVSETEPEVTAASQPKKRGRKPKTTNRIVDPGGQIEIRTNVRTVTPDLAVLEKYIIPDDPPPPPRRGRKPGPKPGQCARKSAMGENSASQDDGGILRDLLDDGFAKPTELPAGSKRVSRRIAASPKAKTRASTMRARRTKLLESFDATDTSDADSFDPGVARGRRKKLCRFRGGRRKTELQCHTGNFDDTKCGTCFVDCGTNEALKEHIYDEHNGLARPFGYVGEPFTSSEEKLILMNCVKMKKLIRCQNECCEKVFTSVGGYEYHAKICGKEHKRKMITCEYCGRTLTPMSVKSHMRSFHPSSPTQDQPGNGPRGKRAAATRALKRVSKMAAPGSDGESTSRRSTDCDYNGVTESDSTEEDMLVEDLFMEPQKLVVTAEMIEEWTSTLKDTQSLECANAGCSKTFTSLHSMKTHFLKCPKKTVAREYTCLICNYSTLIRTKMVIHAIKHKRSLKEDNGVQASDLRSDSDKLEAMFRLSSHAYMYKKRSKLKNPGHGQVQQCILNGEFDERFFAPHVDFAIQFHASNSLDDVYENWIPVKSSWKLLSHGEYAGYIPQTDLSPEFRNHIVTNKAPLPPNDLEWKTLRLFESCKNINKGGSYSSSFTGGPVWSCAWCPTPHTQPCRQFLAVYSHRQADTTYQVEPAFSDPGLIQIWDMGVLENDDPAEPSLCLGITVASGPVWALAWCPSGCWEDHVKNESGDGDDASLPRLGLLASACADGSIRIYSIPQPSCLAVRRGCLPIYQVTPVAVLSLSRSPNFVSEFHCSSLTWYQGKGHQFVAAGFSSGLIGVWDLAVQSQLLRCESSFKSDTIFSYLIFRAHGAIVTGLDFSHIHDGRYLVSVSRDRCIKFWDLHDVSLPYNVIRGRPVNGVKWIPHWGGVFIFGDPCYSSLNNSTTYNECGYFGEMSFSLESHNANIWDVSLSYWLNSLVSCDAAGEVVVAAVTHLLKNQSLLKAANRRRLPLYRIDAFSPTQAPKILPVPSAKVDLKAKNGSKKAPKTVETSEEGHFAPTTFQEAAKEYKLQYLDAVTWDLREIPNDELDHITSSERMTLSKIDEYPLMSVNRVAWNPNLGAHLWIASGEQSGIVRLICVKSLDKVPVRTARDCLLTGSSLPMK